MGQQIVGFGNNSGPAMALKETNICRVPHTLLENIPTQFRGKPPAIILGNTDYYGMHREMSWKDPCKWNIL